jgi:hypothetical protein
MMTVFLQPIPDRVFAPHVLAIWASVHGVRFIEFKFRTKKTVVFSYTTFNKKARQN